MAATRGRVGWSFGTGVAEWRAGPAIVTNTGGHLVRVVLIYLPHPYLQQPDAQAPLGLMYVGAVLENAGIEVLMRNYSSLLTHQAIDELPEADLYGITVTSLELPQANRFTHLIKEKYPQARVCLGGPGTYTDKYVDWHVIDCICRGDGELAILDIINDLRRGELKQLYDGRMVQDLDSLPLPARHLLNGSQGGNIFAYNHNYKPGGSTILSTSRGCPFKCSFCSAPYFTNMSCGMRYRSPKKVYEEIKHVVETYNVRQFRISDDMFLARRSRVAELCELIGDLDIVWRISTRVKPFDKDIADMIRQAGCREVSLGVESFDDQVLKVLNKGNTPEDNAAALEAAADAGLKTRVLFMIRTPGQTRHTVPTNIRWLRKVPYDIIACTSFVPIPGSEIWNHPERYDIEILDRNLDSYNFYFFGKNGENELEDVIKLKDRSLAELNQETLDFRQFLKSTGKLNGEDEPKDVIKITDRSLAELNQETPDFRQLPKSTGKRKAG
ncbi:MAG: B12-binding domain-containing radical SAM protein [Pirellulaceae bacterium]|nr:B12-binding domain-containing radical SAM protein [Pirellulaceae bacterium]